MIEKGRNVYRTCCYEGEWKMNRTKKIDTDKLSKVLGIPPVLSRWKDLSETIAEDDFCCVDQAWIRNLHETYHVFPSFLGQVLKAVEAVRLNEPLCQYTVLLYKAMGNRQLFRKELEDLELPEAENGICDKAYDYFPLLACLPYIPTVVASMAEKGVPEDVVSKSCLFFEELLEITRLRLGRPVYSKRYFVRIQDYLDVNTFTIGCLKFELQETMGGVSALFQKDSGEYCLLAEGGYYTSNGYVKGTIGQTEEGIFEAVYEETSDCFKGHRVDSRGCVEKEVVELSKERWKRLCDPESPVVTVHIPVGAKLSSENTRNAYERAKKIFLKLYPQLDLQTFHCHSWLLDPQLRDLLSEESNIVKFQSDYMRCPILSEGQDVFTFLYFKHYDDLTKLPEKTTLEHAVKNHMLSGKYIYELQGLIPFGLVN